MQRVEGASEGVIPCTHTTDGWCIGSTHRAGAHLAAELDVVIPQPGDLRLQQLHLPCRHRRLLLERAGQPHQLAVLVDLCPPIPRRRRQQLVAQGDILASPSCPGGANWLGPASSQDWNPWLGSRQMDGRTCC